MLSHPWLGGSSRGDLTELCKVPFRRNLIGMVDEDRRDSPKTVTVSGTIRQGNGAASRSTSLQKPFFISAGVARASEWHPGTINLDISPTRFEILKPDHAVSARWAPEVPDFVETFWLVEATLEHKGSAYPAHLYYPCPSQAKVHPNTIMEVLATTIEDLRVGDSALVRFLRDKIRIG